MLTGTLRNAGYYMGGRLYRPREANPKGFFEAPAINWINERLLKPHALSRSRYLFTRALRASFPSERWLATIPVGTAIRPSLALARRIRHQVRTVPFAFKDPRFCYTLPAWRPWLPADTVFVCVFREPGRTVASMLQECRHQYPDLRLSEHEAFAVWTAMYEHVLAHHRHAGSWLFVHYDQVLAGSALPALEAHLDVAVDHTFPDARLKRAPLIEAPAAATEVYDRLCEYAGHLRLCA